MKACSILALSFAASLAVAGPALSQIKPQSSGAVSFSEPSLRKHHKGLIFRNKPGQPRVGYHRHNRRYHQ